MSLSETEAPRKEPYWITALAVVVMIVGARLIRAFTDFGYNVFAEPFDPVLLLGDVLIHFALFFAVLIPLRALWRRRPQQQR
jgi:hypothetical protein